MRTGKTRTGFAFEYDETRLDDMRMVDLTATAVDPEATEFARLTSASKLIELLLGKEAKKLLYEHIGQSYEGRVPYAALSAELEDIMAANIESKN